MGQKVNPIGYRLAVNRDWRSRWYASPKELPEFLNSDLKIRTYVKDKLRLAAVSKIVIERAWNSIRVTIFTARPGIVIGRKGTEIENMTKEIERLSNGKSVKIDIQEIKTPELDAQLVADARSRWQNTVGSLQDAMRVQAGVVGNIDGNRTQMSTLVTQSQGATGALQATQAGNQILALQSQQLSDLVALLAANGRSSALTEAERATAAEQGREQRRRFLTPGSGYQPGNAQMFNGN